MARNSAIRCAVYTRKSTDEGLEQEFNSLDAQRESAEAYIASQKHEGWVCLPERYDDGGFTGGNMERPALRRLLGDVEAGRVDCIVVYKVDRLSRSLMDFSRVMETLERCGVSLVSVTQQFNTTSSMGRLTLNILLSFAQFEREIISERTRDKIAAAKRRGKWSGGRPVLGYDLHPHAGRLVVNKDEAAQVKAIFGLYLDHESLMPVMKEISTRGWHNKRWITKKGKEVGGRAFSKNSLYKLLTNVIYTGKMTYKDEVHEGEHEATIGIDTFNRVQRILKRNGASGGKHVKNRFGALLKGIIRCDACGCAMVPTHTTRNGTKRYRYYVCSAAQKRGWHTCPTKSIPAQEIERFVIDQIRAIGRDQELLAETLRQAGQRSREKMIELEGEKKMIERQLVQDVELLRGLVTDRGEQAAHCLADLQDRIRANEQRATQVREELLALESELTDEQKAAQAFAAFDPVWESLPPREQARLIRLLVEQVSYDGRTGTVSVILHNTGIKVLNDESERVAV
ncbi:MAG TPA: recombinase family protein [Phycisphaerae bacterium]|nr:recombinase family protein [Phycisphaerae bacterium]